MKRWTLTIVAALMLVMVAVPASADDPSIIDIAVSDGDQFDSNPFDFDILTEAVIATGLDEALDDDGVGDLPFDVTVFAPTDQAFRRLVYDLAGVWLESEEEVFNTVAGLGLDTVSDVILYHVVEGEVFAATALTLDGVDVPTLLGPTFEVNVRQSTWISLRDQDVDDIDPWVIPALTDIDASNGVIHGITRVLRPVDL